MRFGGGSSFNKLGHSQGWVEITSNGPFGGTADAKNEILLHSIFFCI